MIVQSCIAGVSIIPYPHVRSSIDIQFIECRIVCSAIHIYPRIALHVVIDIDVVEDGMTDSIDMYELEGTGFLQFCCSAAYHSAAIGHRNHVWISSGICSACQDIDGIACQREGACRQRAGIDDSYLDAAALRRVPSAPEMRICRRISRSGAIERADDVFVGRIAGPERSGDEVIVIPSEHTIHDGIQRCILFEVSSKITASGQLRNDAFGSISHSQCYSCACIYADSQFRCSDVSKERIEAYHSIAGSSCDGERSYRRSD